MAKRIDLTGHVFGYLTAVSIAERGAGGATWLCRCKCGNEKIIRLSNLKSGTTKSCGCLRKEKLEKARFNKPSLKQCEPKKLADDDGIKVDKSKVSIKRKLDMRGFDREMANIERSLYAWD